MKARTLVFPGGMPRSLAFLDRALSEGRSVVGASSLGVDPARVLYPEWVFMPFVGTPDFDLALRQVIADFEIDAIFTPNPVVWDLLNRMLPREHPGVKLINGPPVEDEVAPFQKALRFGRALQDGSLEIAALGIPRVCASTLELAALFRHAELIPGMCDHEKIRALCEVFRFCPAGDIVEIGSWWGKSAFVLAWLARVYGVGSLLCVDPWSDVHLLQNDEKGLVDRVPVDAEEAFAIFRINLLPYALGAVNYLRYPSVDAVSVYRNTRRIVSDAFGETVYKGRIALLHVDGNHSYARVKEDLVEWCALVKPGGWVVIDDYVWPYGDGPKRSGDEFIASTEIACAFVMGSALFVQLAA